MLSTIVLDIRIIALVIIKTYLESMDPFEALELLLLP